MLGAIRKRDILAHPVVTIDSFGWHVFLRVLIAGRNQTFLALLAETGAMQAPTASVPELVDRCVELESQARQIYERLAARFADWESAAEFFRKIAGQEQSHAELLKLCQTAASGGRWEEEQFAPCRSAIPRLEREMDAAVDSVDSIADLSEALQLVVRIESSELNRVFKGVVDATDSKFVRRLRAFQTAGSRHIDYIQQEITRLDPDLADACATMQGA